MANVAKIAMRWQISHVAIGDPDITDVVSTYHAHAADGHAAFTDLELFNFANTASAWWQDDFDPPANPLVTTVHGLRSFYGPEMTLLDVSAQRVEPSISLPVFGDVADPPGDNPSVFQPPPQVAYLLGWRTTIDTRRGRGRVYLPAFGRVVNDLQKYRDGRVFPDERQLLAYLGAQLVNLVGALPGGPFSLAVYSRAGHDASSVQALDVPDRMATQRRRAYTPVGHHHFNIDGTP